MLMFCGMMSSRVPWMSIKGMGTRGASLKPRRGEPAFGAIEAGVLQDQQQQCRDQQQESVPMRSPRADCASWYVIIPPLE